MRLHPNRPSSSSLGAQFPRNLIAEHQHLTSGVQSESAAFTKPTKPLNTLDLKTWAHEAQLRNSFHAPCGARSKAAAAAAPAASMKMAHSRHHSYAVNFMHCASACAKRNMTTGTYCAGPVDSSAPLSYYVTLKLSKVIGKLLLQVVPSLRSRLSVARNGGDMLEGLPSTCNPGLVARHCRLFSQRHRSWSSIFKTPLLWFCKNNMSGSRWVTQHECA